MPVYQSSSSCASEVPSSPSSEFQSGRFTFNNPQGEGRKGGGIRGKVTGMSPAQRRRLMLCFASLGWEYLILRGIPVWFVTLSLPREYWDSPSLVKPALKRFKERLEYHHGIVGENGEQIGYLGAIVRRELGSKHGCLHFHLVIVGGALNEEDADLALYQPGWVGETWTDCLRARSSGIRLGKGNVVRVEVQQPHSAEEVCKYLVKYCSKAAYEGKENEGEASSGTFRTLAGMVPDDAPLSKAHTSGKGEDPHSGWRWWAVWGRDTLPWGEVTSFDGDFAVAMAVRLKRLFQRLHVDVERKRLKKEACQGFEKNWRVGMPVPSFRACELELQKIDKMSVRQLARGPQKKRGERRRERKQDEQASGEGVVLVRKGSRVPFGERLRRSQVGFTILMPPKILLRAVDFVADLAAWDGKAPLKGAVTGFSAWARHGDTPPTSLAGETGPPSECCMGATSGPPGRGVRRREKVCS